MSKSSWRSTSTLREKEWGKEKLWRHPSGFTGKVLYINEGSSTAFKYFLIKDESFMVLKGKLMITFGQQRSLDDPCNYPIRKEIFNEGDVLLAISTSGQSKSIIHACHKAREIGCEVIGLAGRSGGDLSRCCDVPLVIPVEETAHIQECHIIILHMLCTLIEHGLNLA